MKSNSTKFSFLLALLALAGASGWSLARLWPTWNSTEMAIPVLTPVVMSVLACFLLAWTLMVRANHAKTSHHHRLDPIVAARSAALALAASRVGSVAAGFYGGVLLVNALMLDTQASGRCIAVTSLTVLASLIVVGLGLWLEHILSLIHI